MPKGKYLSDSEKGQIMAYHKSELSQRQIAPLINRSFKVVNSYLKDPDSYGQNHRGGRPQALTLREKRVVLRDITNGSVFK